MNARTLYYALVVGLAGFLFGFDTVVISGANLPIKELWQTSDWFHGTFIMSMALWGTVVGALLGGYPTDYLGRRTTLYWIGVLYLVSALGSALATDPYIFSFFRFIGGLGVGASSIAAPTYTSEIAPPKHRGRLVALYQFNIVFGILIAFISNYLLQGVGGANDWRWMLGVEAIPAAAYIIMVLGVPQSPRWVAIKKNDNEKALRILERSSSAQAARQQLQAILDDNKKEQTDQKPVFSRKYSYPLILAFLIAFFNQLSGINFILYYAPEILEKAGFAASESLFSAISIGGVNLLFTMLGLYLIDKAGRKQLMYIGSLGYIISLSFTAYGFYFDASAGFKLAFILLFIASHAIGQGAVIWVFISEIFPNKVRAFGQAWGSGTHWVFAALITLFGAVFISVFEPWQVFAFFAGFMVLQLLFVAFMMPETKGVSLEDLQKQLTKFDSNSTEINETYATNTGS
ncbi:sugar porter family MFS transporter [Marinoscillum furvescens]|uniref:Sugar porter (SP) family MFS transporter n=1 Tax=Marinoscillum furvescens DSM 4134 TaxID=1122208 RepID=A0A3D9LGP1_MARFU|nr:sugar porter family MFS transporter [Marinoscillum furvescens]REE05541.1 sugar porter (SP) family MFS transporter [Marinoscillum furvescens DSM 4134]